MSNGRSTLNVSRWFELSGGKAEAVAAHSLGITLPPPQVTAFVVRWSLLLPMKGSCGKFPHNFPTICGKSKTGEGATLERRSLAS